MATCEEAIHGALLGTVIGDALGLPYEALSRRRGQRLLGPPERFRFLPGKGMMSDDGEHACLVVQALCASGGDVKRFEQAFAARLRWWLLAIPAGIGKATLLATVKLWMGFSPRRSGVFSAGNGPAMRSAILGAAIDDLDRLRAFVTASTTITHTDPKALHGALAVALAAWYARQNDFSLHGYFDHLREWLARDSAGEFLRLVEGVLASVERGKRTIAYADSIGAAKGVSGYVYQSVPVALHAWLSHPKDYRRAVEAAILCGGDTDTVAAMTGGIVGTAVGVIGIPAEWSDGLWEWPRSLSYLQRLAESVVRSIQNEEATTPPGVNPLIVCRNLFFFGVVVAHIVRRALPPY